MKRILLLFYIICIGYGFTWAQPRLTSDKQTEDLGQVQWKEPVRVKYVITNTGSSPLVLTEVTTSCGCAVAYWTETSIEPQSQGFIEVEFNAEMLGTFHKSVAIRSNSNPSLVYLYFTGEVVREITDFSRTHPYAMGNVLLDKEELIFPDVHYGEKESIVLNVVNQNREPYRPILMHLPSFIDMKSDPEVLQKGEKGVITLTLNSDELKGYGLYESSVYLSRFSGDKVGSDNKLSLRVLLLPEQSVSSTKQPQLRLSSGELDFSTSLRNKNKASQTIYLGNQGNAEIKVYKIQVFHPSVQVQLNKKNIQPGQQAKLKITVKNDPNRKFKEEKILLLTNDSSLPNREIIIKR